MLSHNNTNTVVKEHSALFYAPLPKSLHVVYPSSGQAASPVVEVEPQLFAKQCGMSGWSETVLVDPSMAYQFGKEDFPGQTLSDRELNDFVVEAAKCSQSLVIAHMGEKLGYGVYTKKPIAKYDIVAIYAGVEEAFVQSDMASAQSEYLFGFDNSKNEQLGSIDAKKYGNIGRFFQHFPMSAERAHVGRSQANNYVFKSDVVLSTVATANLVSIQYRFNHHAVILLHALRDIKQGEWLGLDYGDYWWNTHRHPLLINLQGQLIPESTYKVTNWILKVTVEGRLYAGTCLAIDDVEKYHHMNFLSDFDCDGFAGTLCITPEDFSKAWQATPKTSAYIFLDKPSDIKFSKRPTEDLPAQKERQPIASVASSLRRGFFKSQEEHIESELTRILKGYTKIDMHYYKDKKTAVIMHDDVAVISEIKSQFSAANLTVKSGRHANTKMPMLYLVEPKLETLRALPVIQNKNETPKLT